MKDASLQLQQPCFFLFILLDGFDDDDEDDDKL